jgi:N-acetylglucosaminyldiphosphoundecaprenol N-acetyl-beta-D-mannosaminyltransferase
MNEKGEKILDGLNSEASIPMEYILGVKVNALNMETTLGLFSKWIRTGEPHYVCCVPAHSIMSCVDQPELRSVFNSSGMCTPDGMAVVWLLKAKGFSKVERVYGPDLILAACEAGLEPAWKHYFYGGIPGTGKKLADFMQQKYPGIKITGWESPPFRELSGEEKLALKERIQQAQPDVLWVAMGSPRQEWWMSEWVNELRVPVLVGVGAAFDFLTGQKRQAPKWIQKTGLEWLFRLFNEPKRLWKRYAVNYPRFVVLLFLEWLGIKTVRE